IAAVGRTRSRPGRPLRSLATVRRSPGRQPMVARVDHGMIQPGDRSRRGPQMSATRDSTLHDPKAIIIDLQRQLADVQRTLDERTVEQDATQRRLAERTAERDDALAREAAIAEVLQVINSSPGDLAPVFDTILEKAHRLCGASKGSFVIFDGKRFRTVAMRGLSEGYAAVLRETPHNPPGSVPDRLQKGENLVHLSDARVSEFPIPRAAAELEGARTIIYVPLRKESALLGY